MDEFAPLRPWRAYEPPPDWDALVRVKSPWPAIPPDPAPRATTARAALGLPPAESVPRSLVNDPPRPSERPKSAEKAIERRREAGRRAGEAAINVLAGLFGIGHHPHHHSGHWLVHRAMHWTAVRHTGRH